VGSFSRRFAIFPLRRVGACLPGSSVSADSILDKDSSPPLVRCVPAERGFPDSAGRRVPLSLLGIHARAKPCLSTKSPCLVAEQKPEESIV